jgi:hypothetical protein
MFEQWELHPYQYVNQNPVAYWDADGHSPSATATVWDFLDVYTGTSSSYLIPGLGFALALWLSTKGAAEFSVAHPELKMDYGLWCDGEPLCVAYTARAQAKYNAQVESYIQDKLKNDIQAISEKRAAVHANSSTKSAAKVVAQQQGIAEAKSSKHSPFIVRLQVQGGGLEESVVFSQETSVTVSQGLAGLQALKIKISLKDQQSRASLFERAARFITNAGKSGGVGPPGKSFPIHPKNPICIDVEVLRGVNFKD